MQDDLNIPEARTLSSPALFVGPPVMAFADPLPNVPIMIGTRLQLELLLEESFIDLRAVAGVILSDPGATLQLLRLIGEEYPEEESRPTRIEDCIASLNRDRWFNAVNASSIPQNRGVLTEWQRLRRVAQCARELAECIDGFSPEEAYLVGLLYEVGKFPHLLGWNTEGETPGEQKALGVMLADYWHLPAYLLSAIREQQDPAACAHWTEILEMARHLAAQGEHSSRHSL